MRGTATTAAPWCRYEPSSSFQRATPSSAIAIRISSSSSSITRTQPAAAAAAELPPAVVGHVHDVDTVLARQRRVLRRRDALEDERDRVRVLEALDVVPRERRLEIVAR